MKNLILRSLTGLVFVALLVGCIVWNALSFGLLFAIITALSVNEFANLANRRTGVRVNRLLATLSGVCLFVAFFGYFCLQLGGIDLFAPYLLLLIYTFVRPLYDKKHDALNSWAYTLLSQVYVALPLGLLCLLASTGDEAQPYDYLLPLSLFIFIWCSDTGAYCVGSIAGKLTGGHRLFERISPKKSWEGSIGGALFAVGAALAMAHLYPEYSAWEWTGMALVTVVFGTWGDLVESQLKRQLGIKDSGNILPGHGGMLDRFDSTLLAAPAVVAYLYLLESL